MDEQNSKEELLKLLADSVYNQNAKKTGELAQKFIDKSFDAYAGIVDGMAKGIQKVGREYEMGTMWLPDMMAAASAMKKGTEILMPHIEIKDEDKRLKIILGTIEGDIHDIGKNIVNVILSAAGFEVIDIGIDVPTNVFIDKAKEKNAEVVGVSALLTSTMTKIPKIIDYAEETGMRNKVKIVIGGAPTSKKFAEEIGADAYVKDAIEAPMIIKELLEEADNG